MRALALLCGLLLAACASEPAKRPTYRLHVPAEPSAAAPPSLPAPMPDDLRELAIAVVLACGGDSVQEYREALSRLAAAWGERRQDDFSRIAKDPTALLGDEALDLRADEQVAQRYFGDAPGDPRAACRAMNRPG